MTLNILTQLNGTHLYNKNIILIRTALSLTIKHDTNQINTQHNDIQHNNKNTILIRMAFSIMTFSITTKS
jgi:hypothetical protein